MAGNGGTFEFRVQGAASCKSAAAAETRSPEPVDDATDGAPNAPRKRKHDHDHHDRKKGKREPVSGKDSAAAPPSRAAHPQRQKEKNRHSRRDADDSSNMESNHDEKSDINGELTSGISDTSDSEPESD